MSSSKRESEYVAAPARLQAVGAAVEHLGAGMQGYRQYAIQVVGVNVKAPQVENGEFMAVIKGLDAEGTPCVAFHAAFSLGELFMGLQNRLRNGSLKWRVDEFMK